MQSLNKILYRLDKRIESEIKEVIHELMQFRDFHMFQPTDDRGNSVEDLFLYWLATTIEETNTRYHYNSYRRTPSIEIQCTMHNALMEYQPDVYRHFELPSDFPVEFNLIRLDNTSYIVEAD